MGNGMVLWECADCGSALDGSEVVGEHCPECDAPLDVREGTIQ